MLHEGNKGKIMKRLDTAALLCGVGLLLGVAQAAGLLTLNLERSLVLTQVKDGKAVESFKANPAALAPGDVVLEQVKVENISNKTLKAVKVDLPLPQNIGAEKVSVKASSYLAGTATKPNNRWTLEFSFDGGKTFATEPLMKKVKVLEAGKSVEKEVKVAANDYTHARWTLSSVAPQEKLVFGLRAKVN